MRLNNKGTSLVELVISITLISIVLLFMFRLLIDVNNEITNDTFAKENQINRAEIIKTVESDLNSKTLTNFNIYTDNTSLTITFYFKNVNESTLKANKTNNTIEYTYYKNGSSSPVTKKWMLDENCEVYTKGMFTYADIDKEIFPIVFAIEIHTKNDLNTVGNNDSLDDIVISYIGKKSDISSANREKFKSKCQGTCY